MSRDFHTMESWHQNLTAERLNELIEELNTLTTTPFNERFSINADWIGGRQYLVYNSLSKHVESELGYQLFQGEISNLADWQQQRMWGRVQGLVEKVRDLTDVPVFTLQPQSKTVDEYSLATFSCAISGGVAPYSYQWKKNGVNVGTNSAALSFTAAATDNAASITVVVSDSIGNVITSSAAILGVTSYLYRLNGTDQYWLLSESVTLVSGDSVELDALMPSAYTSDKSIAHGVDGGSTPLFIDIKNGGVIGAPSGSTIFVDGIETNIVAYDGLVHTIKIVVASTVELGVFGCHRNLVSRFLDGGVFNVIITRAAGNVSLPLNKRTDGGIQNSSTSLTATIANYIADEWVPDNRSSIPWDEKSSMFSPLSAYAGNTSSEATRVVDSEGYLRTTGLIARPSLGLSTPLDGTVAILCDHGLIPELTSNLGDTSITQTGKTDYKVLGIDYGGYDGDYIIGKTWRYADTADIIASGIDLTQDIGFKLKNTATAPYASYSGVKQIVSNAQGIPTIVLTFDDCGDGQYTYRSMMTSNNLGATIFVPWDYVGQHNKLTVAQLLEMKGEGFDIQLDGTADDARMTLFPTADAAVSHLIEGRDWLATNGLNDNAEFFCYPNGDFRIKGTQIKLSNIVGGLSSPIVSMGTTTGIVTGMLATSKSFPYGTRVLTVDSATQVTLTNQPMANDAGGYPITSVSNYMQFSDDSGEFYTNKLQAKLLNAGFKIGRTTVPGYHHTRFGIGDKIGITSFAKTSTLSTGDRSDAALVTRAREWVDYVKKYGVTCIPYFHNIIGEVNGLNVSITGFQAVCEMLGEEVSAGNIQVLSMKQWYDRDCRNPANPY